MTLFGVKVFTELIRFKRVHPGEPSSSMNWCLDEKELWLQRQIGTQGEQCEMEASTEVIYLQQNVKYDHQGPRS